MDNENLREVYQAHRTAQDKYAYFLLAAAGAAIGLALTQTQNLKISWSQIPLAIGVICWGLSFFFGCRHLEYVSSNLYANFELLKVQDGQHIEIGNNPQLIDAASRGIRQALESNSNRSNTFSRLQFRFLITGAIFYIIWHLLEMYLRSF